MLHLLLAVLSASPADTTIRLARGSTVAISSHSGDITVRAGVGDELVVRGARLRHRGQRVTIDANDLRDTEDGVVMVTMPSWAEVSLSSVEGDLTIDGRFENVTAETVNGDLDVRGTVGTLVASAVSGDVTVTDAAGTIRVESVNGSIVLRDIRGQAVHAVTTNDDIEFAGTVQAGGTYRFESHNGEILLALPADVSARMDVSTFNGEFQTAIPAVTGGATSAPSGRRSRVATQQKEFTVTFGAGAASIGVEAFNGSIRVIRATQ